MIHIAKTKKEYSEGLKDPSKNIMYFPNANNMTMKGMKTPIKYYGITDGMITDEGYARPGQKFNVNGISTLEVRIPTRRKAQKSDLIGNDYIDLAKKIRLDQYDEETRKREEEKKILDLKDEEDQKKMGAGTWGVRDVGYIPYGIDGIPHSIDPNSYKENYNYYDPNKNTYVNKAKFWEDPHGYRTAEYNKDWYNRVMKDRSSFIPVPSPNIVTGVTNVPGKYDPNVIFAQRTPLPSEKSYRETLAQYPVKDYTAGTNINEGITGIKEGLLSDDPIAKYMRKNYPSTVLSPGSLSKAAGIEINKKPSSLFDLNKIRSAILTSTPQSPVVTTTGQSPVVTTTNRTNPDGSAQTSSTSKTPIVNDVTKADGTTEKVLIKPSNINEYNFNQIKQLLDPNKSLEENEEYFKNKYQQSPTPASKIQLEFVLEYKNALQNDKNISSSNVNTGGSNTSTSTGTGSNTGTGTTNITGTNTTSTTSTTSSKTITDDDITNLQKDIDSETDPVKKAKKQSDLQNLKDIKSKQQTGNTSTINASTNTSTNTSNTNPNILPFKKGTYNKFLNWANPNLADDKELNDAYTVNDKQRLSNIGKKILDPNKTIDEQIKLAQEEVLKSKGNPEREKQNLARVAALTAYKDSENQNPANTNTNESGTTSTYQLSPEVQKSFNVIDFYDKSKSYNQPYKQGDFYNQPYGPPIADIKDAPLPPDLPQAFDKQAFEQKLEEDLQPISKPRTIEEYEKILLDEEMRKKRQDELFANIPEPMNKETEPELDFSGKKRRSYENPNNRSYENPNNKYFITRGEATQLAGSLLPGFYNLAQSMRKPHKFKEFQNPNDFRYLNNLASYRIPYDDSKIIAQQNRIMRAAQQNAPNFQVAQAYQTAGMDSMNRQLKDYQMKNYMANQQYAQDYNRAAQDIYGKREAIKADVYAKDRATQAALNQLQHKAVTQLGIGIHDLGKLFVNRENQNVDWTMLGEIYDQYGLAPIEAVAKGDATGSEIIRYKGDPEAMDKFLDEVEERKSRKKARKYKSDDEEEDKKRGGRIFNIKAINNINKYR